MSEPIVIWNTDKDFPLAKLASYFADGVNVDLGDIIVTFIDDKTIQFRSNVPKPKKKG